MYYETCKCNISGWARWYANCNMPQSRSLIKMKKNKDFKLSFSHYYFWRMCHKYAGLQSAYGCYIVKKIKITNFFFKEASLLGALDWGSRGLKYANMDQETEVNCKHNVILCSKGSENRQVCIESYSKPNMNSKLWPSVIVAPALSRQPDYLTSRRWMWSVTHWLAGRKVGNQEEPLLMGR